MTEKSNPDDDSRNSKESQDHDIFEPGDEVFEKNDSENDIVELTETIAEPFDTEVIELTEEIAETGRTPRKLEHEFEEISQIARELSEMREEKVIDLTEELRVPSEPSKSPEASDASGVTPPETAPEIVDKLAEGIRRYYGIKAISEDSLSKSVKDFPHQGSETASVEETYKFEKNLKDSPVSEMAFETSLGLELDDDTESEFKGESQARQTKLPVSAQSVLVRIPRAALPEDLYKTLIRESVSRGDEKLYLQLPITGKRPTDMPSLSDAGDAPGGPASMILVSEQAIEKVLEHVIKKLYAKKIETALEEAIQRIVKEDIEKLKDMLLKGIRTQR